MKANKIVLLLASAALLGSCGGSASDTSISGSSKEEESVISSEESISSEDSSSDEPVVAKLILVADCLGTDGNSYANYDGDHIVGDYTVTSSNVMYSASQKYAGGLDVLQFKAALGSLTINGAFSRIVLTTYSTYAYDSNYTFACGNEAVSADVVTDSTDTKVGDYDLNKYTVTATFADAVEGTYIISKTVGTKGAGYVTSIELY